MRMPPSEGSRGRSVRGSARVSTRRDGAVLLAGMERRTPNPTIDAIHIANRALALCTRDRADQGDGAVASRSFAIESRLAKADDLRAFDAMTGVNDRHRRSKRRTTVDEEPGAPSGVGPGARPVSSNDRARTSLAGEEGM